MTSKTFLRTRTFKSERDAIRSIPALRKDNPRDRYGATPTNPSKAEWIVTRYVGESSFSMPVQETVKFGVLFGKPEGDGIMDGCTTQDIERDGVHVGTIECEWVVDYESPCSRTQVRKGTECYILTFQNGHPFDTCEFRFEIVTGYHKSNEGDDASQTYVTVYPNARKALAAAKRFSKAVL
jgi:hypothetical protein